MKKDPLQEKLVNDLFLVYKKKGKSPVNVIENLLKQGLDLNYPGAEGHSSVFLAVQYIDVDALSYMLKNGGDVNYKTGSNKTTLLMVASFLGYHDAMDVLLKAGADLKARDADARDIFDHVEKFCKTDDMKQRALNLLNAEIKARTLKDRHARAMDAINNVDKLKGPLRVKRHSGFKNQRKLK